MKADGSVDPDTNRNIKSWCTADICKAKTYFSPDEEFIFKTLESYFDLTVTDINSPPGGHDIRYINMLSFVLIY